MTLLPKMKRKTVVSDAVAPELIDKAADEINTGISACYLPAMMIK